MTFNRNFDSLMGKRGWTGIVVLAAWALLAPGLCAQNMSPRALEVLHERLLPLFEVSGVVFTDADETTGRLKVGVENREAMGNARERLPMLGVASTLVDFEEAEPIYQVATLRSPVRPVVGGLQIRWSNYLCTIGFPAVRGGIPGFVTNSHCSTQQGAVDGTSYYQPLNQVSGEYIGFETVDPPYYRNNGCPKGKRCRSSDSIFAQAAGGAGFELGKIAKPVSMNVGALEIGSGGTARFTMTGKGSVAKGALVNKVGRTTGWTQGKITNKCANVSVSGTNLLLKCQDIVENKSATIVQGGDSGSNVFATGSGDNVTLVGLLWGGNSSGTMFVYSPIANVEAELGTLTVN